MRQVFGGILLAIGILIAGLSGLCTVLVVGGELISPSHGPENFTGDIGADLVMGGIPFAIGFAMAFGGWKLLNSGKKAENEPPQPASAIKPAESRTSDAE